MANDPKNRDQEQITDEELRGRAMDEDNEDFEEVDDTDEESDLDDDDEMNEE
jgi:hypothetical protein